ncbi:MAG: hypothetical protein ABR611_05920 [Chthoniobacterales bacterium]
MNGIVRSFIVLAVTASSAAYAVGPQMSVIISDSSGRAAYKGTTDASGIFRTASLRPGNYVVQFKSRNDEVKANDYALVISAGRKKVTADSVAGEKFTGGGVAMRIELGSSASISGQVADAMMMLDANGRRLVWIGQKLGSHLPAHWAAEDSADAREAKTQMSFSRKNLQDRQNQGVGLF